MENQIKMADGYVLPLVRTRLDLDIPLFSENIIKTPQDVVDLMGSYMADLAYEISAVVCFDFEMRPMCVSLIGAGDFSETPMPVRNVLQTALLSNAASIAVIHNHPDALVGQADLRASFKDVNCLNVIMKACQLMGVQFFDAIIISTYRNNGKNVSAYYSMKEKEIKRWEKTRIDRYDKGIIKSILVTEKFLKWDDNEDASKYWGTDVTKLDTYPQITTYSPEELKQAIELIQSGKLAEWNAKEQTTSDPKQSVFESQEYKELLKRNAERNEALKRQMELGKAIIQQTKEQTDIER